MNLFKVNIICFHFSKIRTLFSLVVCLMIGALAIAQPTLPDEEIDVIKDFEASLEESKKINVTPELPRLDTTAPVSYTHLTLPTKA